MVSQSTHIRINRKLKEQLDSLKGSTELSYDAVISKLIPPDKDLWKEKLHQSFKDLKEEFPDQENILEYMRIIIINSMDLSGDFKEIHDKELEDRLNDLSHYKSRLLKERKKEEE